MPRRHPATWLVVALPLLCPLALACGGDDDCDAFANASCLEADRIVDDVTTLASPAMTGRRAGTPGNDAAVDLVARRFEALDLRPVAGAASVRDPFPLNVWTASRAPTLRLGAASYTVGDGEGLDVVEFSGPGTVTGTPVVFAGHGIVVPSYDRADYPLCPADPVTGYDDYAGIDAAGATVVILRGYPGDDIAWRDECPWGYLSNTGRVPPRRGRRDRRAPRSHGRGPVPRPLLPGRRRSAAALTGERPAREKKKGGPWAALRVLRAVRLDYLRRLNFSIRSPSRARPPVSPCLRRYSR
jgi:hypothetical protein